MESNQFFLLIVFLFLFWFSLVRCHFMLVLAINIVRVRKCVNDVCRRDFFSFHSTKHQTRSTSHISLNGLMNEVITQMFVPFLFWSFFCSFFFVIRFGAVIEKWNTRKRIIFEIFYITILKASKIPMLHRSRVRTEYPSVFSVNANRHRDQTKKSDILRFALDARLKKGKKWICLALL